MITQRLSLLVAFCGIGLSALGQGSAITVNTVSDLTDSPLSQRSPVVAILGYESPGDWGAPRLGRYVAGSAVAVDNGCVFAAWGGRVLMGDCLNQVNVRWFHAVGDGIEDDTDAVEAARSAANQRGVLLLFPAGSYLLSGVGSTLYGPRVEVPASHPVLAGTLTVSNLVASNSVTATQIGTSNLLVTGPMTFGGETRTNWPTGGGGGGGGGITLSGVRGDTIYHDGTNWVALGHPGVNGRVIASVNGLPAWADFDSGDINFITDATPFTNITTSARLALSLSSTNAGHTLFDTDLGAMMMWSGTNWVGFPIAVPWSPTRNETRLALVCGALRQNATNRIRWDYITNSTHRPINFGGDFAIASSNTLTLPFGRTFTRCVSFAAYSDETFGGGANVIFGARVTQSNAVISAGSFFDGSWVLRYTGSAWSVTSVSGSDVQPTVGYTNGVLTILHDYLRGGNVYLSAWSSSGGNYGYVPVLRRAMDSRLDIEWIDPVTGWIVQSATPLWRMTAAITRRHWGPIDLDGSNGSDSLLGEDTAVGGNVWVLGLFEY